jgi:cyclopropane-fatty-acyl-phospholipid synthase
MSFIYKNLGIHQWSTLVNRVRISVKLPQEGSSMSIGTSQSLVQRDLDHSVVRWIMKCVGNPSILIRLWNGDEFPVTNERPVACMEFRQRRAVLELLRSPSLGFGECYSKGLIEIHGDLLAFMNEVAAAITRSREGSYYGPRIRSILYAMRVNSLTRSRRNVHHHYDLGNDFYKLWLDERMVYTCAYYDTPAATLAEAQVAKLEHVCRKLQLRPGQKVIEAGCGWRQCDCLQQFPRAGRLRQGTGDGHGPGWPGDVRRG